MFNENLPHQQYKLVETPSQATVEELLPNKRTNKNQNHCSQQLSLLQAFRYYIYQLFWSQRWETFIFEVSAISWRAQSYQIMQKYLPHLVLYKQRFLLIHSIYQDSHTVSNLNSAQSNPLNSQLKGSIDKPIFYINKMLHSNLCIWGFLTVCS